MSARIVSFSQFSEIHVIHRHNNIGVALSIKVLVLKNKFHLTRYYTKNILDNNHNEYIIRTRLLTLMNLISQVLYQFKV